MALHDPPLNIPFVDTVIDIDGRKIPIKLFVSRAWAEWLLINKTDKADKVEGGTAGNLATLAEDGNYQDGSKTLPDGELVGTTDSQVLTGKTFSELTATRLVASDGNKKLQSINLADWIEGVAGNLSVTDDDDGTVTLTVVLKANAGLAYDANGIYAKLKADNGLAVDTNGLYIALKSNYGIDVDSDGLKLKQQAHEADLSTTTITDPADSPATADALRDDLVANAISEIRTGLNAAESKINAIMAKLESAEVFATL